MSQPIAIDLFCGLGGWTEGLLAEGYYVVGFDIERHEYGDEKYPGQLVLQDVLSLHGRQFKSVDLIVASPPCQEYSWMAMPFSKGKQRAREYRTGVRPLSQLTGLFDACFRIQREACEAAGHHIPLVVENVRGAQEWVGRSRFNFGSFHLWGDVPALMPMASKAVKVAGLDWSKYGTPGYKAKGFNTTADQNCRGIKLGGSWFGSYSPGNQGPRNHGSKSTARKRASAIIAKIPLDLSTHIARVYHPERRAAA